MKRYIDFILIACVVLGGALYFMRSRDKNVEKIVGPAVNLNTANNFNQNLKNYTLFSVPKLGFHLTEDDKKNLDTFFSKYGFTLTPVFKLVNPESWQYDIGASNIQIYGNLVNAGIGLNPVLISEADLNCTHVVDIITKKDSKIIAVKDLQGKNIALVERTAITRQFLIDKKIRAKKVYSGSDVNWAAKNLETRKIDVALYSYESTPGKKEENRYFGEVSGEELDNYPQLKLVNTINTLLPCRIVYLNKKLSERDQQIIVKTFENISASITDFTRKYLRLIGVEPLLRNIPVKIQEKLVSLYSSKDNSYAEEVIKLSKK